MLCVGNRRRDDPHTVLASGGINAALGTIDPEDSWEQHAADTLREGYWLSDPMSVELLCRAAPRAIEDLLHWGARLAREQDGRLTQRFFGAHRYRRTCFAGDYTGREIQRVLVERALAVGVELRYDVYLTRLLVHDGHVFGAHGFDLDDGSRRLIVSDAVVLAEHGGVLLDISQLERKRILERLPRMYRHSMGGVRVDPETHATDVAGLFAVGSARPECAAPTGLAANSLAECLVFGRVVAEQAARWSDDLDVQVRDRSAIDEAREEVDAMLARRRPRGPPDIAGDADLAHAFDLQASAAGSTSGSRRARARTTRGARRSTSVLP